MSSTNSKSIAAFRRAVWAHYRKYGRYELPWRKTTDPYRILVSEMMLQQTQVPRVIPKYKTFLKRFPTVRALAKAPLSEVLKEWSGLGYNRRAKYLHDAVKNIPGVNKRFFNYPAGSLKNRGVGPYTRDAVAVFAHNEPRVLLETNIRTAYIHHFFPRRISVSDEEILEIARRAMPKGSSPAGGLRTWHWALMDYGAHLKASGIRNNSRSAHAVKQSRFEGSLRQVRGQILRELMKGEKGRKGKKWEEALASLARDGLIVKEKGKWRIA
jgi:A/G-specific adenine glycosylase